MRVTFCTLLPAYARLGTGRAGWPVPASPADGTIGKEAMQACLHFNPDVYALENHRAVLLQRYHHRSEK